MRPASSACSGLASDDSRGLTVARWVLAVFMLCILATTDAEFQPVVALPLASHYRRHCGGPGCAFRTTQVDNTSSAGCHAGEALRRGGRAALVPGDIRAKAER